MDENRLIGKDNDLVWHLPNDLKHFKNLTAGHAIIMGRKTFESLGKPLPKRTNIIVTRNSDFKAEGCLVCNSIEEAIKLASEDPQPFIVGGAEIYKLALPLAHTMELTRVHGEYEGDTWFPEWEDKNWKLVSEESHQADEKHEVAYTFYRYKRETYNL